MALFLFLFLFSFPFSYMKTWHLKHPATSSFSPQISSNHCLRSSHLLLAVSFMFSHAFPHNSNSCFILSFFFSPFFCFIKTSPALFSDCWSCRTCVIRVPTGRTACASRTEMNPSRSSPFLSLPAPSSLTPGFRCAALLLRKGLLKPEESRASPNTQKAHISRECFCISSCC